MRGACATRTGSRSTPDSARFFINDVGQSAREEINEGSAGANYGWNSREGQCPRGQNPPCAGPPAGITDPIATTHARSARTSPPAPSSRTAPGRARSPTATCSPTVARGKVWLRTASGSIDYGSPILTGAFGLADMTFVNEPGGTFLYYTLNGSSAVRKLGIVPVPVPQTLQVQVTGVAGVPADADAVVLNMTAVNARTAGFATVYPCGQPRPQASNLNFTAGQTIPNLVIAKPGSQRPSLRLQRHHHRRPRRRLRLLPRRIRIHPHHQPHTHPRHPQRHRRPDRPARREPDPATPDHRHRRGARNADAVVLNMTAVTARTAGFATVYPCGQRRPQASNLNFTTGQTIPNLVIAKPGVGGKVCVYSDTTIDVLADVSGYFPAGSGFTPITNPTRILDTRNGIGAPTVPLAANQTLQLQTTGTAGVPANADAVVLNMTAVTARTAGFATVYPCGQRRPQASNLNFTTGQTIPNLVIAKPGVGGKVCVYSDTTIDVLADVSGYFPAGSGFTPITNPTRILDTRNGIGV